MLALVALAIASGVEGSNYGTPSDVSVGQKLAQAYGVLYIFLLSINVIQWGALWIKGNIGKDVFAICCSVALFFVYLKAIYLICSAWIINISLRNPFVNAGWYAGCAFTPDFIGSLLMAIGGLIAPSERRDAAVAYLHEREMQNNGQRHDWTAPPSELPKGNNGEDYNYARH